MRILMATFGSLGDIHPYIALGRELNRRGHRPAIASTDRYRALVEANGIDFHEMRPHEAQMGDPALLVEKAFHPVKGTRFLLEHTVMRYLRESYEDLQRAAAGADLIVTHPLTVTAVLLAQKKSIPWASSVLAPLSLLSTFDPPLLPAAAWLRSVRALGHWPYRAVFGLVKASCRGWERPLRQFRAELGLPATTQQALFEGQYSSRLNLALFSSLLARPAPDWPRNTSVCGFARFDGPMPDASIQRKLDEFLCAGEPPLAFALGSSAVMIAGGFWDAAVDASRRLGRRAILLTGVPGTPTTSRGEDVAEFSYLPYSTVFPRAAAVIHHAGMGTLSQALAAGRPQLMVPLSFDQPDNADRAARLGVGRVLPFVKVSAIRLEAELRSVLGNRKHERAARTVAELVADENGAALAADALEQLQPAV